MNRHRPTFPAIILLIAATLALAPTASAQTAQHDVTLTIPSSIGIRIVGAGTGPRSITFDYATNPNAYITAIDNGGATLPPTSVTRFDDIEANVIVTELGFWYVNVQATPLTYTGPQTGAGLNLNDIRINRGSNSGLTQTAIRWFFSRYDTTWTLSTTPQPIARSLVGTNGWRSLGFNGTDYTLNVNGNEAPGTYTTTVTYYLTFP